MSHRLPWFRKTHLAWFVQFQGKQVRLHEDKEEAFRLWHLLEAGVNQSPTVGPTLSVLIDAYLADCSQRLKPSSMEAKGKVFARLVKDKGDTVAERFDLLAWVKHQQWGQTYTWFAVSQVKAMMRWAVGKKMLAVNPVAEVKVKGPLSRGCEAVVSPEDHARIMAAASPFHQDILTALWETGCRPCEECSVEARHFDPVAGCWRLDTHKTDRSGKVRVIYLRAYPNTLPRTQ